MIVILSFFFTSVVGQTIEIKALKSNSTIETAGTIKLIDAAIELENVTLKCETISFAKEIVSIKISGNVKIICKHILLEGAASAIIIDNSSNGNLSLEYSSDYIDNGRSFQINAAGNFKMNFIKK